MERPPLRVAIATFLQDNLGNDQLDAPWVGELMDLVESYVTSVPVERVPQ